MALVAQGPLGTVDSPEEAFFVARYKGLAATCEGEASAAYRPTDDGFELVTLRGGCMSPVERVVGECVAMGRSRKWATTAAQ